MKKAVLSALLIVILFISISTIYLYQNENQNEKFRFVVYGDSRTIHNNHRIIMSQILARNSDIVLHVGDMVTDGASEEDWEMYLEIVQPVSDILYPAPGNHEEPFEKYFKIYDAFYNNTSYYSFNYNGTHFISLDSNTEITESSDQYTWLLDDLEKNSNVEWIFVFFHHPLYTSSEKGNRQDLISVLSPVFENYGVDLVFSGHAHNYERTYPLKQNGIDDNGVIYIVTGGGGAPLHDVGVSWWTAKSEKEYHFVEVEVLKDYLVLKAIDINDNIIDQIEVYK